MLANCLRINKTVPWKYGSNTFPHSKVKIGGLIMTAEPKNPTVRIVFGLLMALALLAIAVIEELELLAQDPEVAAHFSTPFEAAGALLGLAGLTMLGTTFFSRSEKALEVVALGFLFFALMAEIAAVTYAAPFQPVLPGEFLAAMRLEVVFSVLLMGVVGVRLVWLECCSAMGVTE